MHTYLLDDQGIGHLKQGMRQVGHWVLQCGGLQHSDWCSHHTKHIILDLLQNSVLGNGQCIVH